MISVHTFMPMTLKFTVHATRWIPHLRQKMSTCVDEVAFWMHSNRLQLNTSKTEVLSCATNRRQHQIPHELTRVGNDTVQSASSVRELGIYLDSEASIKTHVPKTVSCCFNVLRQIRSIRRSVTRPVLQSLVVSLVSSRLDYGNATLAGLTSHELNRLQSVLNAAARLIFSGKKHDQVTPLLRDLHWLRVQQRIEYKIAVRACLPVSSWTSSGVYVFPTTECEGSTIKATTTIVVIALPTRAYIATVNCWRSCFSSCRRTSLEYSLSRCHLSQLSASFQTSAEDGALSTELSGSCSSLQLHLTNLPIIL